MNSVLIALFPALTGLNARKQRLKTTHCRLNLSAILTSFVRSIAKHLSCPNRSVTPDFDITLRWTNVPVPLSLPSYLYFKVYFMYNENIIKKEKCANTSLCNLYRQGGGCQILNVFSRTTLLLPTARGGFLII
jgi:hypothetical protein